MATKPAEGFTPLDPFPAATAMFGADRLAQIAWAFVGLGIVIRMIRFLLNFPLWPDEAYLAHNYLDRGYLELLRPLDYGQVAPLLYLWVQKTVVAICGFSEYSLRLYAFLGSIASLLVFRHLAGRLLPGIARLLAIGIFAVAYPLIRYAAEAKPYGSDMLVTLLLLALLIEWRLASRRTRWFWALAVAMPLAVLLSYPAMFVVPAISLAMLIELFRSGGAPGTLGRRQWLAWLGVNVATAGGLALLFFASAHAQIATAGPDMQTGWEQAFPPLHSAKQMALFLLESHTGEALAYPAGGAGQQFADDPLLAYGPGVAPPWAAILAGHAVHGAAGVELHRRRAPCLSLYGPYAGNALHGPDLLPLDRPGRGGPPLGVEEPPLVRRRTGGRGRGAPGDDRLRRFRARFSQAV